MSCLDNGYGPIYLMAAPTWKETLVCLRDGESSRGRGLEARETGRGQHLKLDTGGNDEGFMDQLDEVTVDLLGHFNNTRIFVETSQMD